MGCGGCGGNAPKPVFNSVTQRVVKTNEDNISTDISDKDISQFKGTKPNGVFRNLIEAAGSQPNKLNWFWDGAKGIARCLGGKDIYNDDEIRANREVCKNCEFASAKDKNGNLTVKSQCMGIDPKTKSPCSCFLLCLTQSGKCKLDKWTHLTINGK